MGSPVGARRYGPRMEQPREDRVTVTGRAARSVVPDRAEWRLTVTEQKSSEAEAYAVCTERANALLETLRATVGDDGTIRTSDLSLQRGWDSRGRRPAG